MDRHCSCLAILTAINAWQPHSHLVIQDTYLSLDDPTLIYYLALALLKLKRDILLEADMGEVRSTERGRG